MLPLQVYPLFFPLFTSLWPDGHVFCWCVGTSGAGLSSTFLVSLNLIKLLWTIHHLTRCEMICLYWDLNLFRHTKPETSKLCVVLMLYTWEQSFLPLSHSQNTPCQGQNQNATWNRIPCCTNGSMNWSSVSSWPLIWDGFGEFALGEFATG